MCGSAGLLLWGIGAPLVEPTHEPWGEHEPLSSLGLCCWGVAGRVCHSVWVAGAESEHVCACVHVPVPVPVHVCVWLWDVRVFWGIWFWMCMDVQCVHVCSRGRGDGAAAFALGVCGRGGECSGLYWGSAADGEPVGEWPVFVELRAGGMKRDVEGAGRVAVDGHGTCVSGLAGLCVELGGVRVCSCVWGGVCVSCLEGVLLLGRAGASPARCSPCLSSGCRASDERGRAGTSGAHAEQEDPRLNLGLGRTMSIRPNPCLALCLGRAGTSRTHAERSPNARPNRRTEDEAGLAGAGDVYALDRGQCAAGGERECPHSCVDVSGGMQVFWGLAGAA